jgi:transposase
VWQRLHELLLAKLHEADLADWDRAAIDSSHVRAFGGSYHSRESRGELRRRRIHAKIAWPKSGNGSGLGTTRWVVERTIAWLHHYRRLRIRYERRDDIHEAFLAIGCSLIRLKLLEAEGSF